MAPFGTASFTSNLDGVSTVCPTTHLVVLLVLAFFLPWNSLDGEWAILNHIPSHPQGFSRANVERMLFYSIKNVAVDKKLKIMFILNVFVPQSLTGNHKCVNNSSSSPSCHLTVTTAELAGQFWQLHIWAASPVYAHLLLLHLSYSVFFSFFLFVSKHHGQMSVKQPRSYFQRLYYSTIVLPSKLIFTEVWPKGILQSSV